jgi:hypothetical protein
MYAVALYTRIVKALYSRIGLDQSEVNLCELI